MSITVLSIARVYREPNKRGTVHLAYCTLKLGDLITLQGCLLVENADGSRAIWAPSLANTPNDWKSGVKLGAELSKACEEAASQAYQAFLEADRLPKQEVSAAVALVQELERREAA